MGAEAGVALAMHHAGADGDELEQVGVPFEALDGQLDADNAVRAHGGGFRAHPVHRQLARMVHGLGQDIEFLVAVPHAVLDAHVIHATADAQADGLKPGLAHQQELVDREVRREDAGFMRRAAQALQAFAGVDGQVEGHQIGPSRSLDA